MMNLEKADTWTDELPWYDAEHAEDGPSLVLKTQAKDGGMPKRAVSVCKTFEKVNDDTWTDEIFDTRRMADVLQSGALDESSDLSEGSSTQAQCKVCVQVHRTVPRCD